MTRVHGGLSSALAALVLGLVVGLPATATAQAATGVPPVTTPDAASMYPGNLAVVFPIDNDLDADNDELTICRLGSEHYKGLEIDTVDEEIDVFSRPSVKPGIYTFTYYACDFSYLTPGTITITVTEPPHIEVTKIAGRPGRLRVTNPADFKIQFLYGSRRLGGPDGRLAIAKDASLVIAVHRTTIDWVAYDRKSEVFLAVGTVRNIRLPAGDQPAPGTAGVSPHLRQAWCAAR
jgi:hypothetical protein